MHYSFRGWLSGMVRSVLATICSHARAMLICRSQSLRLTSVLLSFWPYVFNKNFTFYLLISVVCLTLKMIFDCLSLKRKPNLFVLQLLATLSSALKSEEYNETLSQVHGFSNCGTFRSMFSIRWWKSFLTFDFHDFKH